MEIEIKKNLPIDAYVCTSKNIFVQNSFHHVIVYQISSFGYGLHMSFFPHKVTSNHFWIRVLRLWLDFPFSIFLAEVFNFYFLAPFGLLDSPAQLLEKKVFNKSI